jgi:hypothetical protein
MANLLPPNKAAEALERAAHDFLTAAQAVRQSDLDPVKNRALMKNWRNAYSELAARQWELEKVLGWPV